MKRLLLLFPLLLLFGFMAQAQIDDDGFTSTTTSKTHYTVGDLAKMGKLELTSLYIQHAQKLTMLLPYIPFNQKGEAVSLVNMGIPNTKDNNDNIKKLDVSASTHNEVMNSSLNNIVPYSDTKDIIQAILFLQDIIERLETGI